MQYSTVLSFFIIACIVFVNAKTNYDSHKIYDVKAKNHFEKSLLRSLADNDDYDCFSFPKSLKHPVRLMVQPDNQKHFEKVLYLNGIDFEIINVDIGQSDFTQDTGADIFSKFQRYDEINAYLETLSKRFPKRVSLKNVGRSFEGRDMITILITNGDGRKDKKVIFIDAGIHAREWIAPATALYIIYQLTENFKENADLLKDYDWLILPVVNPDGYEYTHTTDRQWRKTRKPVTDQCVGTDGNRNFAFHWGDKYASDKPCTTDFMGIKPFSEPETQIVRDIMHSLKGRIKMYLTLHSFGNKLLYPWGFTEDLPPTWKDLDEVAQAGASAIREATGTTFTVGSSTNVLYEAPGGSDDYALGAVGIPISITMELQEGGSGFNPTAEQIKPFVKESWIGIKAMGEKVILKY